MRMREEPDRPARLGPVLPHGGQTAPARTDPAPAAAGRLTPTASGRLTPAAVMALQRTAGNAAVVAMLQRQADEDRQAPVADPGAECRQVLSTPGRPMPDALRTEMEARLGADFSDVRLHTDTVAQRSAEGVGARAYTSRNHVVGAAGMDKHTLAHELTHVEQQRRGPVAGTDQGNGLRLSDPSDRFEQEAEANAHRVMAGPTPVQRLASGVSAPAGARHGRAVGHAPGNSPGVVQRKPENSRFTAATSGKLLDLTEANYVDHVNNGIASGNPMAFIVNAILPWTAVRQIPQVIASILNGFTDVHRVGVVLGVNAREGREGELDAALAEAGRLIERCDIPVALVRSVFKEKKFPYGTMRNEVLHSAECGLLTRAFAADNLHPYISVQDFDTGSRLVSSGAHVFSHFEQRMEDDEEMRSDGDRGQPMRPLLLTGGYRVASTTEEALVAEVRKRYTESGEDLPDVLIELPSAEALAQMSSDQQREWEARQQARQAFLNGFTEAVTLDMAERARLARIHPLLPYAPEPNLLFDALPNLLRRDGADAAWSRFPLAFGAGGAEFGELGKRINQFNAWELTQRYSSAYENAENEVVIPASTKPGGDDMAEEVLPQDRGEINAKVRVEAENNRLGERGQAFFTDFTGAAVPTDLSRLAKGFLDGKGLPQSHVGLTGVLDRFFESRAAKKNVTAAKYRDGYTDPASRYMAEELLRPSGLDKDGNPATTAAFALPSKAAGQLGNKKANSMGYNISAPLAGPFAGINAGISPHHQLAAAREMALSTPQLHLGRYLALLTVELGRGRGTPMDGNCLYHAVNQVRGGTADLASAAALRQQVVNWALAPANLSAVTQYASEHGVGIDDLIATLVRNGNWRGAAGDLVPRMIAATLGITLVIHDNGVIINVPPLTGPSLGSAHVELAADHYSVWNDGAGTSNAPKGPSA